MGPLEKEDPQVCQATVDQDCQERKAVRGDQVFLEHLDKLVRKVSQVQVKSPLDLKACPDHVEKVAHKDFKVTEETRETKDCQVSLESRVTKVSLDLHYQVHLVPKESLEFQEILDHQENKDGQGKMV